MDRSVVFLDLKGGCAPCDKPLMLRPILFCPVLTWVAQELTVCGAQRFFIVCDEAWQDEVREAMEGFDTRLFASAQEALADAEGEVIVVPGPVVPVYGPEDSLRTAEMYLIIAEALNEINQGANEEAVIAINAVRNRAGLTTAVPTDYKGFKNAVLNEYRHEFVMEGHRWFDLTRMCTPQEFVSIIKAAKPESTPKEYHVKFPIPQREIDLSQNTITQNEGYGQ